jgi:hypothetical protein
MEKQIAENPAGFLWPPWQLLRMYVSRSSDEKLYYGYTELLRGREVSQDAMAEKRAVSVEELRIRSGTAFRLPHRDFSVEYPPLLWAAIFPPALFANSLPVYRLTFGLWMALGALATALVAWKIRRRSDPNEAFSATAKVAFLMLLALGPLLVIRFDMVPAFLTLLAAERAVSRKPLQAGLALAAGVACKIYPLVLAPVFVAAWLGAGTPAKWKQIGRFFSGLALVSVIFLGPFLLLAPREFILDLSGHAHRPLEVESVLATPFLLVKGAYTFHAFGCCNLWAPGSDIAARISGPLSLVVLAGVLLITYRAAKRDFAAALTEGCALLLLGMLCTAKVLSSQYLIWILPFFWIRKGRRSWRLSLGVGVAMVLAQVWYPLLWSHITELRPAGVGLLLARNSLLIALFVGFLIQVVQRDWATKALTSKSLSGEEGNRPRRAFVATGTAGPPEPPGPPGVDGTRGKQS